MHLSPVLKKTLGILCVALLCASSAVARTGKKSSHKQVATASTRTHSTRTASATHKRSKAESSEDKPDKVARSKSKSKSKSSSRHASKRKAAPETDEDATPASRKSSKSSKADRTTKVVSVSRPRGQQGIDGDRAREIQEALIREHYLDGDASGIWDARTRDAMVRFQNDNGWQTRIVPDSRALIKLGLGPKHAGLLNPEAVSESIPNAARETRPGGGLPQ